MQYLWPRCSPRGMRRAPRDLGRVPRLDVSPAGHDGRMGTETPDPLSLPWHAGQGRKIYAQGGAEPSRDDDMLIGVMDTPELAARACEGHNALLSPHPAVALANAMIRSVFAAGDGPGDCPDL